LVSVVRIRKIEFSNFKAFSKYSVTLNEVNLAVGPNNAGKSTIIGALRTLDSAIRFARSRAPSRIAVDDITYIGYRIPDESVPISLENVQTDYNEEHSRVDFSVSNGNSLALVFPNDGGCILIPSTGGQIIRSASDFKREFPVALVVVPVLGPIEHNEDRRERSTVVSALSTHRASRHFRSYWHYFPDEFESFAGLLAKTWPGMSIQPPEYNASTGKLAMFCLEGRITRELYWVGFGFQIWCQLLTHLMRAAPRSLVVVDEPETYLHPDVQRQLLAVVRELGADVLMATHSSEIIADADPTEILMVDKRKKSAERLKNIAGVQDALDAVGSSQNITLTALARSRRILFVEGFDDFRLFRRFARRIGLIELSSGVGITPLESGGFGSWQKVTTLAEGIEGALGAPLMIGAVYDRDFFCPEHISHVEAALGSKLLMAEVLSVKEIENYLLNPTALEKAIVKALELSEPKGGKVTKAVPSMDALLRKITDPMKDDVLSQLAARRAEFFAKQGLDQSTILKAVFAEFYKQWDDIDLRLRIVSGKDVLRELRQWVQIEVGVTLTEARIVDAIPRNEIPADLCLVLHKLDSFRKAEFG
jgi:energy-coupling factor transporter ATP-binding protein EcfA2